MVGSGSFVYNEATLRLAAFMLATVPLGFNCTVALLKVNFKTHACNNRSHLACFVAFGLGDVVYDWRLYPYSFGYCYHYDNH